MLKRIALLLEIIADELYVARMGKEFEDACGPGPDAWNAEGRDYMTLGIERMRQQAEKVDVN